MFIDIFKAVGYVYRLGVFVNMLRELLLENLLSCFYLNLNCFYLIWFVLLGVYVSVWCNMYNCNT